MKKKVTLLSTAATALIWAVSATAQTATPETAQNDQVANGGGDKGGVAEIIVTAQKRAENVQPVA